MNRNIKNLLLTGSAFGLLSVQSCTDLSENVYDQIPQGKFGQTQEQLDALIGPLYSGLGDYYGNFIELSAVTDEVIVPTRGGDWKDGDAWKRLDSHTWEAQLDDGRFNGLWTWIYNNSTSINQQLLNPAITDAKTISELKTLRAFYHYLAMDNFGNALIADKITEGNATQKTRADLYAFVETELTNALPNLSTDVGGLQYGRMTQWVAHMILAKLYLNAQVYTGTPQWAKAAAECDAIINSGKFQLAGDFLSNFVTQNQTSPEIILATPMDATKRGGMNPQMRTLHYLNQLTYDLGAAPWNGFATMAEFYDSFEDADVRKSMWIIGQQYKANGEPLIDDNVPLVFKKEIPSYEMPAGTVARAAGARSQKYQIQKGNKNNDQDNDFVIYRLADVYLMRGEAKFRLGDMAGAMEDINFIRTKRGVAAFTALTADDILAERGRELAWECLRRQDLIRFGQFGKAWTFKPASPATRELFPIPQSQINLNANLKQNPGY